MSSIYSQMKIFYYRDKIDSLTQTILPPIHVRIKPTNICNHHCHYCSYRADSLQLGKEMNERDFIPKDKMREIIQDLDNDVQAITFSGGGEPLCYPYIKDTLKQLRETSIKFAMLTNGSLLRGEVAELLAFGGSWVRISIDGWDDESYSLYRNVPRGEFTKVIRNAENFKKLGGPCTLGASIIVDKANVYYLSELIKILKDVGVDNVRVTPCVVSDDVQANRLYHGFISNAVEEQMLRAKELSDDSFVIVNSYDDYREDFEKDYEWCPYIQITSVIGADQNVYSCHDKAYTPNGLLGSIKDVRFSEFWFSNRDRFLKINPSVDCNHHCVANGVNKPVLSYLNVDKRYVEFV